MFRHPAFIMRHNPNRLLELIRMKLRLLLAVWLVYGSLAAAQDVPCPHVRFFNAAKAVSFFVDGQFGCSVPANPEKDQTLWPILRHFRCRKHAW
jgi:hypothetical protein